MVNIYVEERVARMRMAALERDLARQQRVLVASATSTATQGWSSRSMRWLRYRLPAWTTQWNRTPFR